MVKIKKWQVINGILLLTPSFISCGNTTWDFLIPLPTFVLNINEKVLDGIKEEYCNDNTLFYNKLTIPKTIETMTNFICNDNQCVLSNIKKIDYELNCNCQTFLSPAINNLLSLETIILPPKITNLEKQCIANCLNLKIIDITNVIEYECLINTNWISNISPTGSVICKQAQKDCANQLIESNKQFLQKWSIIIK